MRRFVLTLATAALVLSAGGHARSDGAKAAKAPELDAAIRALVRDRTFSNAQIGIVIMDADSGEVLAQHGEHAVLNPASNAKCYTAAAALSILKGSHRYHTTLAGKVNGNGIANMVLKGQGDPSLQTEDLYGLVVELKAHGIRRVDGDLLVDQRYFDEQTTPPAFEQQPNEWAAFRAPVSAVALNANTITLMIRPTTQGQAATSWFDPPGFVNVEGSVKTGDDGADSVGLSLEGSADKRMNAKLSGTIGGDAKLVRYTRRVEDPRLLAGYALKAILEETGVKVGGEVKLGSADKQDKPVTIARHESSPLSTLLYALGKSSDNFYAEMVFKTISAEAKRPGKSADAADAVASWVTKNDLGDTGVVIKNGSGLFDSNRTTAFSVAKLLRHAWQDPAIKSEFVAQLAIGGVDGTLHKRFGALGRSHRAIRAKTGTLDDAIALSGYVLGPPGKSTIAFSILFNKVSGHGASARSAADKLVELVHERQWESGSGSGEKKK